MNSGESSLSWATVRTDTIDRFQGQTPRPEDEAPIIDIFEQHPALVLRAIDETAQALAASKITWAWSVLKARLERGTTALREATVDTGSERTRRIRNAKLWIENAGLHYDRQDHVLAELFGDDYARGPLTDYANDDALRAELVDHWRQQRPRGEQAGRDFEAWNAKCAADHQLVLETRRTPAVEPDYEVVDRDGNHVDLEYVDGGEVSYPPEATIVAGADDDIEF